ncbi:MAG: hypothetical protein ACJ8CN_03305 [Gemmatimonadales bacterium]
MSRSRKVRNERGIALITVLLVALAVSSIALAAAMWTLNATLITKSGDRTATLNDIALAGLEEGRSQLNANPAVYPSTGYATLATAAPVTDVLGNTVPNVLRSIYVGPDGITGGQYGVYGTIISTVRDTFGNQVVRRLQINQESFAKFSYFTNTEGNIVFANNDQIRGPVHSNDQIKISNTGATFFDQVTTAAPSIQNEGAATFMGPAPKKNVAPIAMPTTAAFPALQARAAAASMSFVSNLNGNSPGEASLRIEFVAVDLNGDGDSTDVNEGFIRVYQDNLRPWYVTATLTGNPGPAGDIRRSPNCGAAIPGGAGVGTNGRFRTAADTNFAGAPSPPTSAARVTAATNLLSSGNRKCYLGGDPRLTAAAWPNVAAADWAAVVGDWPGTGRGWIPRPGGVGAPTGNALFTARPDNAYLWPINREYNPAWQGVIYVQGKVALSGVVNGRVTVASPNTIVIADDFRSAVDPGSAAAADCAVIAGLFAGADLLVANNTINAPQQIGGVNPYRTYDETTQEDIHAVLLALNIFGAESYDTGPASGEACGAVNNGRGCLNLNGGVIQNTRGAVGLVDGHGYVKRYSYNACAATDPPPYFPTTGRFVRNRIYELDPKGFTVAGWFAANQNN